MRASCATRLNRSAVRCRALKRLGVRLLIHDFGTGESSLKQLAGLPIDAIKVGRQFVAKLGSDDDSGRIARALIATGTALGLDVIGAGAETDEQVEQLRRLNGFGVQGFLFSAAVPAKEITALLADDATLEAHDRVAAPDLQAASSICDVQVAYISA